VTVPEYDPDYLPDTSEDVRRFRAGLADELAEAIEGNDAEVTRLQARIEELKSETTRARAALRVLRD
jgi:hypothetical protein